MKFEDEEERRGYHQIRVMPNGIAFTKEDMAEIWDEA